ncbi:LOW QUALITY PROTEIN: myeloid-associated differentiation marker homolog [Manacus candei]|uniref:LOW QUALITY PROTEIN: myeloid-associated differentiation marker homolog n=1 Tax=Manacus candei TaxID=415023 RepID=UPI002227158B|nr:LOW QUALITY PROTEIN: myeloid-associated differentiation marker homolog [Manacus candei]
MPAPCRPPSPLRCVQALSALLALSLAAAAGPWLPGEGDGCLSAWALSFVLTLLLLANDAFRRPPPRRDVPLALACAAAMACAAATVLWPLGHLRGNEGGQGRPRALRAAAAAFSAVATLAYAAEVTRDRARPGEAAPYLATPSGLLKVAEAFLALLLLGLAAELGAASGPAAWRWCLGIFCVPFVLGVLLVGGCLLGWGWCGWMRDPEGLRWGLGVYAGLGVVAYGAATVLWALYGFSEDMGGRARRPYNCSPRLPLGQGPCSWPWLSGLNLVAFGVDLGQTGRLVLLRA